MTEEQPIPGFPNYLVCDDGTVFNAVSRQPMKPSSRNGYLRVWLHGPCKLKHRRPIHLLVLEAFVGPRPSPKHHGAHKDGDKTNNRADNLVWKLPEANEADKKLHGTAPKGSPKGGMQAAHPTRVRAILRRVQSGESYTQVAGRFGLHRHSVSRIVRGLRRAEAVAHIARP